MKNEIFRKIYADYVPTEIGTDCLNHIATHEFSKRFVNMSVTRGQAAEDIGQFFDILKYAYAGYDYYKETVDFEKIKTDIIESLPDEIKTLEILDLLYKNLSEYINDSHFTFVSGDGKSFKKLSRAYFTDITVEEDGGGYSVIKTDGSVNLGYRFAADIPAENLFETFPAKDGRKRFLIGVYSPVSKKSLEISGFTLVLHECRTDKVGHCSEAVRIDEYDGVPVIMHSTYCGDYKFEDYRAVGRKYRDSENIVWNLLSNGGGNSRYPESFMEGLNTEAVWKVDVAVINKPKQDGSEQSETPKKSYTVYFGSEADMSQSKYQGNLFVLQNKGVASSGEAAVMYARNVKNVRFVGSATMGCGQFGDTLPYVLKNSGLSFFAGYKVFNMDGFEEGIGFMPDYWLDSENPVADIINYIK